MHDTAFVIGKLFFETYAPEPCTVVEIGSMDVNGALRTAAPVASTYIGIDLEPGPGVDIVVAAGSDIPLQDACADIAVASSAFEHDPQFWRTFNNLCRVTKPGGYIYINAPSNGAIHAYPIDCWRFYPDAGLALEQLTNNEPWSVTLVESFVAERQEDTWNDYVAVFRRNAEGSPPESRMHETVPCRNVYDGTAGARFKIEELTEDMRLLATCTGRLAALKDQMSAAMADRDRRIGQLEPALAALQSEAQCRSQEIEQQTQDIERLNRKLEQQTWDIERLSRSTEQQALEIELKARLIEQRDRDMARLALDLRETRGNQHALNKELEAIRRSWLYRVNGVVLTTRRKINAGRRRLHFGRLEPLFDPQWYMSRNPDVARSGADPFQHYLLVGAANGCDPHPLFSTSWYLANNSDVAAQGVNPLVHFCRFGARELRSPHPLFDCGWYLRQHPGLVESGMNPLQHYLDTGAREGADPHPLFDTSWYLANNPDVAGSGINPLVHFVEFGARELRMPHPLFDSHWYMDENPDVLAGGMNPLEHYLRAGAREGRDPNPAFDTDWYRATYLGSDSANPLVHYVTEGLDKGLAPNPRVDGNRDTVEADR
ncbi:class I SAM-dependent methyltransferase [Vineibacter terrae]|uniref:class I SAM-dependent methyltransferase n=1 Tax=Vineibacter terrae TaxID=2586908 RepID=UPI002E360560|nr:methyltransferase domain-containing protein [Vineibacter terrae]HEX2886685.1 methyltransferase domain-containing protein [Vineibacter terrae]